MLLIFAGSLNERQLVKEIDRLALQYSISDAHLGLHVYAPMRDKILYSVQANKNYRPASNMKIITTLLAFEHLGPNYSFHTSFWHSGELVDGVLHGDLIVVGHGDPSIAGYYLGKGLETHDLVAHLIDRIKAFGIKTITGDVVAMEGFFDDKMVANSWEWDDIGTYYGTPVTALSLNDGWVDIAIHLDGFGFLSTSFSPTGTPDFQLATVFLPPDNEEDSNSDFKVTRDWNSNAFSFMGPMKPCSRHSDSYSVANPAAQFVGVLRDHLLCADVMVDGSARVTHAEPGDADTFLFNFYSPKLADLAKVLMKRSQNHYADSFLKTVAKRMTNHGSFQNGFQLAQALIDQAFQSGPLSGSSSGFNMIDGSGLSSHNYVQPIQLVALLEYAMGQPYWNEWVSSFPVMGVDGTTRRRGSQDGLTQGRIFAKTGYIYRTRCLSGYAFSESSEPILFSIMVNNYGAETSHINDFQDEVCSKLVQLKPNRVVKRALVKDPVTIPAVP